jgi:pimeloyl-ACP methyl ester carboxylesterase
VIAPDLPFEDPELGYEARARPAVEALTGAGDVVLVAHSLGAAYAPLVARERPVSSLVYLCPAPVGPLAGTEATTPPIRPGFPFPEDDVRGVSIWDPDAAIAAMYPRLPEPAARELAHQLRPGSSPAEPYRSGSLLDVRVELVLSTQDEFFSPEWAREVAHLVFGVRPVELEAGHFPMVEMPERLAEVLDRLSRQGT